jgi:hypothetical protein
MMSQLKHTLCLGLLVSIFGLLVGVPLWAAEPQRDNSNWDNLKQLASGQEIKIVLNDAKSFQGKFQSVSDEALVIRLATGEQTFNRQSVLRVSSNGQSHRLRNAALGAVIGVVGGAAIGAAGGHGEFAPLLPALGGAIIGLPIGTGVGAALPTGGWHDVYRAR